MQLSAEKRPKPPISSQRKNFPCLLYIFSPRGIMALFAGSWLSGRAKCRRFDPMPDCQKCGQQFPCSIKLDGKKRYLHKRNFCLDCSPFGQHNTRNIAGCPKVISCIACTQVTRKGSRFCPSCLVKVRRYQIKQAAIDYKGGCCLECKQVVHSAAFEFHHRNSEMKDFEIGPCANRSMKSIKAELDKCDLLCATCHRTKHSFCEPEIMQYVQSKPLSFANMGS